MTHQLPSPPNSKQNRFGLGLPEFPHVSFTSATDFIGPLPEYLVDAFQRNVLFLDLLRRRGNEEIEITSRPMATVLRFEHELLMSGLSLPRPINYALYRIMPPT